MNVCFVCETPFHVFSAVNYIYHHDTSACEFDIYIGNFFNNAEKIAQRLSQENWIRSVYFYKDINTVSTVKRYALAVCETGFPQIYIRQLIIGDAENRNYERIFIPGVISFGRAIINANPMAEVCYFDDGTGSYAGAFSSYQWSLPRRLVSKIFKRDLQRLEPRTMYLNNPDYLNSDFYEKVCKLPDIDRNDSGFFDVLSRIFDYFPSNIYADHRLVFLDQPNDYMDTAYDAVRNQMISTLEEYKDKIVIRPHPRQLHIDYGDMCTDKSRDSWELVCMNQINEKHILVGMCSTAQFIPKMIFNCEPRLVFTHRLLAGALSSQEMEQSEELWQSLHASYLEKSRICAVETLEEMKQAIQQFILES